MTLGKRNHIRIPEKNEQLAEFLGILTGDGYIGKYPRHNYVIEIAGDSRHDKAYFLDYISPLIQSLFGVIPKIIFKKNQHTMCAGIRSQELYYFLREQGFPSGKKNQIDIPLWILENDSFFRAFLRGMTDTDGSVCLFNKPSKYNAYYPAIQITSKSEILIQRISAWSDTQGMQEYITRYERTDPRTKQMSITFIFRVSGRKLLEKWIREIGFHNQRHLNKIEKYKNMGRPRFERGTPRYLTRCLQPCALPG